MSWLRNVWRFLSKFRVEPVLFVFYLSTMTAASGTSHLSTQKICYPDAPPDISAVCKDPKGVKEAADLNQVKMIVRDLAGAGVALLAGSWRDATRRSAPLIILSHLGELSALVVQLISGMNWGMSPWLTVILDSVLGSLFGGRAVLTSAILAYITDKSTSEERSSRILVMLTLVLGATTIATFIAGKLLISVGFPVFFIIMLVGFTLSFLLSFFIRDGDDQQSSNGEYFSSIKRLKIVFKKKPNNLAIWSLICSTAIINALLTSEGSVSFLYLQYKFDLPPDKLGFFGGFKMISSIFGAVISIPVLKHVCKLSRFQTAAVCTIPSLISVTGLAFATDETQLYIFATFDCLRITLLTTLMTIFSDCLPKSEIGVYTSFLSFAEGCLPLALGPLYLLIFRTTLNTMPGAFYLVSMGLILISSLLTCIASFSFIPPESEDDKKSTLDESSGTEKI